MKKILLYTLLSLTFSVSYGQQMLPVDKSRLKEILTNIELESKKIATFEADFVEEKSFAVLEQTAVSKGKMLYASPNQMRWEYQQPHSYIFILNKDKTKVINQGKVESGDKGAGLVFREISKMIVASISGTQLVDESRFFVQYSASETVFKAVLKPKNKRMSQFINELHLSFSLKDYGIQSIEMKQGGDATSIIFKNKRINGTIDKSKFKVD